MCHSMSEIASHMTTTFSFSERSFTASSAYGDSQHASMAKAAGASRLVFLGTSGGAQVLRAGPAFAQRMMQPEVCYDIHNTTGPRSPMARLATARHGKPPIYPPWL